jgi:hypothetical protein
MDSFWNTTKIKDLAKPVLLLLHPDEEVLLTIIVLFLFFESDSRDFLFLLASFSTSRFGGKK